MPETPEPPNPEETELEDTEIEEDKEGEEEGNKEEDPKEELENHIVSVAADHMKLMIKGRMNFLSGEDKGDIIKERREFIQARLKEITGNGSVSKESG